WGLLAPTSRSGSRSRQLSLVGCPSVLVATTRPRLRSDIRCYSR
ncbi:hypothetical protein JMJ77_0013742, partial [Colletotrichum scovillei]